MTNLLQLLGFGKEESKNEQNTQSEPNSLTRSPQQIHEAERKEKERKDLILRNLVSRVIYNYDDFFHPDDEFYIKMGNYASNHRKNLNYYHELKRINEINDVIIGHNKISLTFYLFDELYDLQFNKINPIVNERDNCLGLLNEKYRSLTKERLSEMKSSAARPYDDKLMELDEERFSLEKERNALNMLASKYKYEKKEMTKAEYMTLIHNARKAIWYTKQKEKSKEK